MRRLRWLLPISIMLFLGNTVMAQPAATTTGAGDPVQLLNEMFATVSKIEDYQCILIKTELIKDKLQTEEIFYTFKQPKSIRMEWIKPKKGLKAVYDGNKMRVSPMPVIKYNIDPYSEIGHSGSNHYIDESDLPSIMRRFEKQISDTGIRISLISEESIADSLFDSIEIVAVKEESQLYCHRLLIWIDRNRKLPYKLEFYDQQNLLFEKYIYNDLKVNSGVDNSLFQL